VRATMTRGYCDHCGRRVLMTRLAMYFMGDMTGRACKAEECREAARGLIRAWDGIERKAAAA
jgi:hypothetical protein